MAVTGVVSVTLGCSSTKAHRSAGRQLVERRACKRRGACTAEENARPGPLRLALRTAGAVAHRARCGGFPQPWRWRFSSPASRTATAARSRRCMQRRRRCAPAALSRLRARPTPPGASLRPSMRKHRRDRAARRAPAAWSLRRSPRPMMFTRQRPQHPSPEAHAPPEVPRTSPESAAARAPSPRSLPSPLRFPSWLRGWRSTNLASERLQRHAEAGLSTPAGPRWRRGQAGPMRGGAVCDGAGSRGMCRGRHRGTRASDAGRFGDDARRCGGARFARNRAACSRCPPQSRDPPPSRVLVP